MNDQQPQQEGVARLRCRGLRRSFVAPDGRTTDALGPIDLDVAAGEFLAVIGPSGCGKSTLIHILAGLLESSAGTILVDGTPSSGAGADLGVVFQRPTCLPWLTVRQNVALALRWRGVDAERARARVDELLVMVRLETFGDAWPHALSGGMQQRVAIARSLAAVPKVLFLDEPLGALDAQTRLHLQLELAEIWRRTGATMVLVTHDIDEAIFLADRVLVLTPRPGRCHEIVPILLPRPRQRSIIGSTEFANLRNQLATSLEVATTVGIPLDLA